MDDEGTGLRERKKRRTRRAIEAAAMELFLARGFEQTTIADIAAAAEVSPRTFFSYFAAKEDVVFAKARAQELETLRAHLASRPPGRSAIDALGEWMHVTIYDPDFREEEEIARHRLIASTPALAAYESAHVRPELERVLREAVAEDLGSDPGDLGPRLVAAAVGATLNAVVAYHAAAEPAAPAAELVADVIAFLDAGLAALGASPAASAGATSRVR